MPIWTCATVNYLSRKSLSENFSLEKHPRTYKSDKTSKHLKGDKTCKTIYRLLGYTYMYMLVTVADRPEKRAKKSVPIPTFNTKKSATVKSL